MIDITKYNNKTVFCKTKREALHFLQMLENAGYLWTSGAKPTSITYFGSTTYKGVKGAGYSVHGYIKKITIANYGYLECVKIPENIVEYNMDVSKVVSIYAK